MNDLKRDVLEKKLNPLSGYLMLSILIGSLIFSLLITIVGGALSEDYLFFIALVILGVFALIATLIAFCGFKIVAPNEASVLLLFGKYYGTIATPGFFWVNPFCKHSLVGFGKPKISLKALTLNNEKQKVNDSEGNPIEIGVVVIWRIVDTAKAMFHVDNFGAYISIQADSAIRHVARQYPYDVNSEGDEKSLRGSSSEVAEALRAELQLRADVAGIEILDTRISHLAYAPEIAQAMLQRQQANAIIAARQKIVEGAVSMVEMALNKLDENKIVELDPERKAQMVSNLLVILCGNKDAQPIINSGNI